MLVNLLVNCQYYENYNVGPDGFNTYGDKLPHWKPKGGHTFKMPISSDTLFYAEEGLVETAIKTLVEKENSIAAKFEFIDYVVEGESSLVEGLEEAVESLYKEVV